MSPRLNTNLELQIKALRIKTLQGNYNLKC